MDIINNNKNIKKIMIIKYLKMKKKTCISFIIYSDFFFWGGDGDLNYIFQFLLLKL